MASRDHLTDDEARRLWERAAQLQAEAARRLDAGPAGSAAAAGDDSGDGSGEDAHTEATPPAGYSIEHVRQAAVEAGIAPEFVDRALVERDVDRAAPATRFQTAILGETPSLLSASRVFEHPPEVVFESMKRLFPGLRLALVDTEDEDPLRGGWLHFEVRAPGFSQTDRIVTDLHQWADVRKLSVRLRPLGEDRCEVTLRAPLDYARTLNSRVSAALSPIAGALAAVLGGAIGSAVMGGVVWAPLAEMLIVGSGAAAGFGLGGGGALRGFRALTRLGRKKGKGALDRILSSLATDIRMGGAFTLGGAPSEAGLGSLSGGSSAAPTSDSLLGPVVEGGHSEVEVDRGES